MSRMTHTTHAALAAESGDATSASSSPVSTRSSRPQARRSDPARQRMADSSESWRAAAVARSLPRARGNRLRSCGGAGRCRPGCPGCLPPPLGGGRGVFPAGSAGELRAPGSRRVLPDTDVVAASASGRGCGVGFVHALDGGGAARDRALLLAWNRPTGASSARRRCRGHQHRTGTPRRIPEAATATGALCVAAARLALVAARDAAWRRPGTGDPRRPQGSV